MRKPNDKDEQVKRFKTQLFWLSKRMIAPSLTDEQVAGIREEICTLQKQIHVLTEPVILADILPEVLEEIRKRMEAPTSA